MKKIYLLFVLNCVLVHAQDTKLNFYAQPGVDFLHSTASDKLGLTFRGAQFIAYITSNITDRLSAAVELHPHVNNLRGPEFEIERLFLKYYIQDYFSLRAGRMYMPIGYWNQSYNFAYVMNPVIRRPNILQPIHEDGFINTRDVGIQIEGNDLGALRFSYKFMISNGVGSQGGLGGNYKNYGTRLAYSANLNIQPIDGLKLIASAVYYKTQAGDATQFESVNFVENIQHIVYNGSVVYMNADSKFELIAEYISTINAYQTQGNKNLYGAIFYVGYKATDKLIPYMFAEFTKFDKTDPLFAPITGVDLANVSDDLSFQTNIKVSPGIRYRITSNAVLKFEYNLFYFNDDKFVHGPSTQFAIGF